MPMPSLSHQTASGAQRRDVLTLVVGQGVRLALIGVAVGVMGAFALTRIMSSLLCGVSPGDPATFGAVVLLVMMVAMSLATSPHVAQCASTPWWRYATNDNPCHEPVTRIAENSGNCEVPRPGMTSIEGTLRGYVLSACGGVSPCHGLAVLFT